MDDREKSSSFVKKDFGPRKNEWIKLPEVLLITGKGENIGVVKTEEARRMALEAGLDLVEVGPNVRPPVCKIMDYSKYIYEQKKKQRKSNKAGKVKDLKEFRFTPVIDIGDMNTRIRRAVEFLEKGHPVRLTMVRKGRLPQELAKSTFDEILTKFSEYSSIEPEPKSEGNRIHITFLKKNGKIKNEQNSDQENQAF